MKYKILLSSVFGFLLLLLANATSTFADDAIVNNGAQSDNTVQSTTTSQSSVQSNNTTTVNNTVLQNTSTGGNSTDFNTGSSSISTGNVTSDVSITNQGNSSSVTGTCCAGTDQSKTQISGNGADSANSSTQTTSSSTDLTINQNAQIHNTISGTASTENNTASGNTGSVTIHTGSINSTQSISNGPINTVFVAVPVSTTSNTSILNLIGNGALSQNTVNSNLNQSTNVSTNNYAELINESTLLLSTGGNKAELNVGKVDIATGNIISKVTITNNLNTSTVDVSCCHKNQESPTPQQPSTPPTTTTTTVTTSTPSSGGGGGSSSGGSVLSAATAQVLPMTGGNWTVIFFLGNIIMLFLGVILRLHSGRSPSLAVAM